MPERYCFDCVYFVPENMRRNDLKFEDWDEGMSGDCRRRSPAACPPSNDDGRVTYGYWPTVLAGEWCGEFEERDRAAQHAQRGDNTIATTRTCAECAAS